MGLWNYFWNPLQRNPCIAPVKDLLLHMYYNKCFKLQVETKQFRRPTSRCNRAGSPTHSPARRLSGPSLGILMDGCQFAGIPKLCNTGSGGPKIFFCNFNPISNAFNIWFTKTHLFLALFLCFGKPLPLLRH